MSQGNLSLLQFRPQTYQSESHFSHHQWTVSRHSLTIADRLHLYYDHNDKITNFNKSTTCGCQCSAVYKMSNILHDNAKADNAKVIAIPQVFSEKEKHKKKVFSTFVVH